MIFFWYFQCELIFLLPIKNGLNNNYNNNNKNFSKVGRDKSDKLFKANYTKFI